MGIKFWYGKPKKRHQAGLLSEKEVYDSIKVTAFKPLDGFKEYTKLRTSDICTCEEEPYCDVEYQQNNSTSATEEEFNIFSEISDTIKKTCPDADITMIDHIGTSDKYRCDNTVTKKSVLVTIKVGAFSFSQDYATPKID